MRLLGTALILLSTLFFAFAGIFTKSMSADAWTIASWRGLIGSILIGLYVLARRDRSAVGSSLKLGWRGWTIAIVSAVSAMLFVASFKYTYVANVTAIYTTVPFMVAAIEWAVGGEKARPRTLVTATISITGVAVIVGGGIGGGHLAGDLTAIAMTFLCAVYLVMVRTFRDTPVVWAAAVSALLVFPAGWLITDPMTISAHDAVIVSIFGCSFAAAVILWTEGARLLPATESGLLGAAEVPFAIFIAWTLLSEVPPVQSIVGAAIVLFALFVHTGRDVFATQSRAAAKTA